MSFVRKVLYNILTRKYNNFCCLCLKSLNANEIHVQDEMLLDKYNSKSSVKIWEILVTVLGTEICNMISSFETICKQCTKAAVDSYNFIIKSKKNSEILLKSVNNLSSCLGNTDELSNTKTMFLTINKDDFTCQKYLDSKRSVSSTSTALKRINSLSNMYQSNLNIKTDYEIKTGNDFEEFTLPKRKRKHYTYSVSVKTSEMIVNKDDRSNFQCKVCFKIYPSLSNIRNHFIRVHSPKTHKCPICHRKFGSQALVEAHQNDCHCTLVCKECGRTFHNRHTLKMHEISHNLKLICQDCGRTYKSQLTFKKHIDLNICGQKTRASPDSAKFTCDYCNKKYSQKVSLRVHIQYEHGNYKGHECKWCKKKFWAQSRLKAHIIKHTQEKKFSCNLCGGKFVSKESLLYHTRTHTGEKPYKCEFCDVRFISASRKADHKKRHHVNAVFPCNICKIKYTTQVCLEKHMKTHENNQKCYLYPLGNRKKADALSDDYAYLDMSDEHLLHQDLKI